MDLHMVLIVFVRRSQSHRPEHGNRGGLDLISQKRARFSAIRGPFHGEYPKTLYNIYSRGSC